MSVLLGHDTRQRLPVEYGSLGLVSRQRLPTETVSVGHVTRLRLPTVSVLWDTTRDRDYLQRRYCRTRLETETTYSVGTVGHDKRQRLPTETVL